MIRHQLQYGVYTMVGGDFDREAPTETQCTIELVKRGTEAITEWQMSTASANELFKAYRLGSEVVWSLTAELRGKGELVDGTEETLRTKVSALRDELKHALAGYKQNVDHFAAQDKKRDEEVEKLRGGVAPAGQAEEIERLRKAYDEEHALRDRYEAELEKLRKNHTPGDYHALSLQLDNANGTVSGLRAELVVQKAELRASQCDQSNAKGVAAAKVVGSQAFERLRTELQQVTEQMGIECAAKIDAVNKLKAAQKVSAGELKRARTEADVLRTQRADHYRRSKKTTDDLVQALEELKDARAELANTLSADEAKQLREAAKTALESANLTTEFVSRRAGLLNEALLYVKRACVLSDERGELKSKLITTITSCVNDTLAAPDTPPVSASVAKSEHKGSEPTPFTLKIGPVTLTEKDGAEAYIETSVNGVTWPEPGQHIATLLCPSCGTQIKVEHGDESGDIIALASDPLKPKRCTVTLIGTSVPGDPVEPPKCKESDPEDKTRAECVRRTGHSEPHRNFAGREWPQAPQVVDSVTPICVAEYKPKRYGAVPQKCKLVQGHDGDVHQSESGFTWPVDSPDEPTAGCDEEGTVKWASQRLMEGRRVQHHDGNRWSPHPDGVSRADLLHPMTHAEFERMYANSTGWMLFTPDSPAIGPGL